ncbi:MAG: tRNA pseudouridine(38-40) synthase TruA [Campylobacteraceae bacterium]|nr:tRNA pseudouridine(38-40) synthase TruA [Campylobacteraceae bacterium]
MNVKFTIQYDGTDFFGSQKQPNKHTIENALLKAFLKINIDTKIILSGRTDKEVHASGQVFNTNIPLHWKNNFIKLQKVLNQQLPLSIRIKNLVEVNTDFHSRFDAKKRVYRYLISTKEKNAFSYKYISYVKEINEDLIKEAIKVFVGIHDFSLFHKLGSDKEYLVREIFKTSFYKYKDIYVFKFTANSYLRSQIRLMVGFLLEISRGKLGIEDLKLQIQNKHCFFKKPADPYGLYLSKVIY